MKAVTRGGLVLFTALFLAVTAGAADIKAEWQRIVSELSK